MAKITMKMKLTPPPQNQSSGSSIPSANVIFDAAPTLTAARPFGRFLPQEFPVRPNSPA